jgi:hypothetical protein
VKTIAIVGIIASILALATAATTATLSNIVYAKDTPNGNDPNLFGKEASKQAQREGDPNNPASEMGEHAKAGSAFTGEPPFDSDGKKGRSGIGNIGDDADLTCTSKHPADLAAALTGKDDSCPEGLP